MLIGRLLCPRESRIFRYLAMNEVKSRYFIKTRGSSRGSKLTDCTPVNKVSRKRTANSRIKLEPHDSITNPSIKEQKVDSGSNIKEEIVDGLAVKQDDTKSKWEPRNWLTQLENIRIMRKEKNAPVDTMGCEKCKGEDYSAKDKRFHTLISLMLSSQTKDHITHAAMQRLIKHGLTAESIVDMSDEKLGELIYPVGFWKKKISYIKRTAEISRKDYSGDIPQTVVELVKLPGVGPKMAYLTMTCAWNQVVGIGVDVHVHRISNRLGWVRKKTTEPEKTRKELEDWLPRSYWREVNWLLVGFGQQICLPISPKCSECLNKNICPSSNAKTKNGKLK